MPSLDDVARSHTSRTAEEVAWLHRLVSDWQLLADLSFADLVLWLPDADGLGYWAGAQMRPTTGTTAYVDDLIGGFVPQGRRPLIAQAFTTGRICREGDPEWRDDVPVRVETIPVSLNQRVIAVIARSTNLLSVRTPSRLELVYLQMAGELARMIAQGRFPDPDASAAATGSPRVGDGLATLDANGRVGYVSPNAMSAYRRLGWAADLVGADLGAVTMSLVASSRRPVERPLAEVLRGGSAVETEVDNQNATLAMRVIPLVPDGVHTGAMVLIRDVTDLRHRERELLSREATIREIHHRVKNNLQTVAALLRMQARRTDSPVAADALREAERRIGSIAVVHELLSQALDEQADFDIVLDRLLMMVGDVAATDTTVVTGRVGSVGDLEAETATALAMALTELLQNAVEHGLGSVDAGEVIVSATWSGRRLRITVVDDGVGLDPGFDLMAMSSLGLQIVRTLVETELDGTFSLAARVDGTGDPERPGTEAVIEFDADSRWRRQ
ncbi:MAG TPA: histidine kinase N-terminal domain-containing protein [Actinopolymorphaceae bacterium]